MTLPMIRQEPHQCPTCGSDEITYTDGDAEWKTVTCEAQECTSIWIEYWAFQDYEMKQGKDNQAHMA